MSFITIRTARAADRNPVATRLQSLIASLFGWGSQVRREREEAALLGRMSARELRDIGLVRVGDSRFLPDRDLA